MSIVVEHAGGPSNPPRYSSNGANSASSPVGIGGVEYEGFEVDDTEENEDGQNAMVEVCEWI